MSFKLTIKQRRVLEYIYTFLETSGFPPSISDLKKELNVASNQSVLNFLDALEKKGYIKREEGQARGLKILPVGFKEIGKDALIRVAGATAAGPYIESYADAFTDWLPVEKGILENEKIAFSKDNLFAVQVNGDSMINIGINDGDYLLVKKVNEFKSGDVVVAETEKGTTVKRFIAEGGKRYLQPENPAYERIIIVPGEVNFRGRVILNLSKIK